MRSVRRSLILAALALGALPLRVHADGGQMVALHVAGAQADLADARGTYLEPFSHAELGVGGELWYFLDPSLAMAVRGRYSRARDTETAASASGRIYRQWSWSGRLGVDRVADLGHGALLYFGPGVEVWRGKAQFLGYGTTPATNDVTSPEIQRLSISARLGAVFALGEAWGLQGEVGSHFGRADAESRNAKTNWYTQGFEASAGLVFAFGDD